MYEIRCIVSDKKVLEVMDALDGKTLEPPVLVKVHIHHQQPPNGGGRMPKSPAPGEGATDRLRHFVKGKKTVTPSELRLFLEGLGFTKNGYSYALKCLRDEGVLRAAKGLTRTYEVI